MKTKHAFLGSLLIGILAGGLRILQNFITTDGYGFDRPGSLSTFLGGVLVGLLGGGLLWSLLAGRKQKEQADYSLLFSGLNLFFLILAALSLGDGILRLIHAATTVQLITGILSVAAAPAWVVLGLMGARAPALLGALPILRLGMMLVAYFWETYKYIRVPEYTLADLGLCALCLFTLLVMKALAGADCTKGRLTFAACAVLVLAPVAFLAPLALGFTLPRVLLAAEGICYIFLADIALQGLGKPQQKPEPTGGPDLSELNEYINNLPEVEDESNEQA